MKKRLKDEQWAMAADLAGNYSYEQAQLAVLMDLRDELKALNGVLRCPNFLNIPFKLDAIVRQTKPKRKVRRLRRVA